MLMTSAFHLNVRLQSLTCLNTLKHFGLPLIDQHMLKFDLLPVHS